MVTARGGDQPSGVPNHCSRCVGGFDCDQVVVGVQGIKEPFYSAESAQWLRSGTDLSEVACFDIHDAELGRRRN